MAGLGYEQPFHTDVAYYQGRANGIATSSGAARPRARSDLSARGHGGTPLVVARFSELTALLQQR